MVSSLGEITAGLSASRVELAAAQVFSSATAPDGAVWIGTGDQPVVYRWDGRKLDKVCRLEGVLVSALAAAPDGTVYAAALPGARLWKIVGDKCSELPRLEGVDQVWALLVEPARGRLLAGTGPTGKLLSVELASGKSKVLWESGERHLLSLLPADGGGYFIGSGDEGILFRLAEDGSARAVHDFAGDEVRALVRAGDRLYAAVNEFEKNKGTPTPAPSVRPAGTRITLPTLPTVPAAGGQPPGRDRKGKGAVFRIDGDGRVEQVHALADGYFTALGLDPRGEVVAAAGASGRLYVMAADRTVVTALSLPERQILTLALSGPHPVLGTGDAGALYGLDFAPPRTGRWTSKVFDAAFPARWGAVRFTGSGPLGIESRAGNTARPDRTWSEWQPLASVPDSSDGGHEAHQGRVRSPPGRYLQLRAQLGARARLLELAAWYLPQNQRPRVTEVTVGEDPASGVARAARVAGRPRSPVVKIRWKVENPDEDELVFRLAYRQEGEPNWRPLGGADPLTGREWDWNTESIPDGKYQVRVVASDERANPREQALDFELVGAPVLVDNRKPEVQLRAQLAQGAAVSGSARDSFSPLADLAYAIDGGDYQPLASRDGVLDDLVEEFSIKLPANLAAGAHSITVRATDAADNVGLGQLGFEIKR